MLKIVPLISCLILQGALLCVSEAKKKGPPNIVLLYADDLGYGDLGCYGHPYAITPNIDSLANKGLRFTDFHSAASLCSPSRAALLTGRYYMRSGIFPGSFTPSAIGGLPSSEITIAEYVKEADYSTAIIGKWHLGFGVDGEHLPTNQGFDYFMGLPYSHNQGPCTTCFYPNTPCFTTCSTEPTDPPVPLMENTTIIEQPVNFLTLHDKYVNAATSFIKKEAKNKKPFFLYMAFAHSHTPQYAGEEFTNSSIMGRYGDAVSEMDGAVGKIMEAIRKARVGKNTLVFFTSDNGPELLDEVRGGNPSFLKCGKGTTYEGGLRVPAIAWWPKRIKPGKTNELACTLDLLPTILNLAGVEAKEGVTLDGYDMAPILFDRKKSLRDDMYYYSPVPEEETGAFSVRYQQYKAHYVTQGSPFASAAFPDSDCRFGDAPRTEHDPPILFDLHLDIGEVYTLTPADPEYNQTMSIISQRRDDFNANVVFGESQMNRGTDPTLVPCASPGCTPFPACCQT